MKTWTADNGNGTFSKLCDFVTEWAEKLIPQTTTQWAVTAVVAAFAFLGLGVATSLAKGPPPAFADRADNAGEGPPVV